jgi:alpha-ribazole phosphatase
LARLLLVRHGETELQSSLRFWGKTDVPLGATGLRQAEQLRDRLETEKIGFVFSSDLKRAFSTARIIADKHGLNITTCPELREVDFGKLEGLEFSEIHSQFPEVERMWVNRDASLVYPDGESLNGFEHRVARFQDRLKGHGADETILVVAHAGVLRTLICQILEFENKNRWSIRLDLASLSIVETYPEVNILSLLNDVSHLMDGRSFRKGAAK